MRYLTKEWFLACQAWPIAQDAQKKLDDLMRSYHEAQLREALPDGLREKFSFHDGVVRQFTCGQDCTLRIDSPFSSYHTVIFRNAVCRQALPPVGAVWLYEELYRHKSGTGLEAHILFSAPQKPAHKKMLPSDLIEWKILCSEIVFAEAGRI